MRGVSHAPADQSKWFKEVFTRWLDNLPVSQVVFIAGNHDFFLQTEEGIKVVEEYEEENPGVTYLQDMMTPLYTDDLGTITIYGSPWTPNLPGWAFQAWDDVAPSAENLASYQRALVPIPPSSEELYEKIPENLDILISHGPPQGYGDKVWYEHTGSQRLLEAIRKKKPRVVICGHIHEGFGQYQVGDTTLYCVPYLDRDYSPTHSIVEVKLNEPAER